MEATWKPLRVSNNLSTCPPLFTKIFFTPNSYAVYLTDLRRIWGEDMDRKSIFKRALLEETPIDPTEDAAQARLLLDHIKDAVDGRAGTHCQLTKNMEDPEALTLHLTVPLPGSFGDLEWKICCKPLPPASLQRHLISPLISKACDCMQQVDALIAHLNAKDHVISKLLDRLESSGIEISSVFPGASGARGPNAMTPREQAARQVQGLGPFDSTWWRRTHAECRDTQVPDESLSQVLKVSASTDYVNDGKDADGHWLSRLPSATSHSIDRVGGTFAAADKAGHASKTDGSQESEEEEFEVRYQLAPPLNLPNRQQRPNISPRLKTVRLPQNSRGLKYPRQPSTTDNGRDSDRTTDDEDLDERSGQHPRIRTSASPSAMFSVDPSGRQPTLQPQGSRDLSRLQRKSSKQPAEQPINAKTAAQENSAGSEPELEECAHLEKVSEYDKSLNTEPSDAQSPKGVSSRKSKLGVLGGRKTLSDKIGSVASDSQPKTLSSLDKAHSGEMKETTTASPNDVKAVKPSSNAHPKSSDAIPNKTTSEVEASPTPNIARSLNTEQERADRKRDQLKLALERPETSKKKRKF